MRFLISDLTETVIQWETLLYFCCLDDSDSCFTSFQTEFIDGVHADGICGLLCG